MKAAWTVRRRWARLPEAYSQGPGNRTYPVVAIAGAVEAADELLAQGFAAVFPIQAAPTSLPEAMETARAAENIRRTVKQIVNLLKSFGQ